MTTNGSYKGVLTLTAVEQLEFQITNKTLIIQ